MRSASPAFAVVTTIEVVSGRPRIRSLRLSSGRAAADIEIVDSRRLNMAAVDERRATR